MEQEAHVDARGSEIIDFILDSAVEPQRTQRAQSQKPTRGRFTLEVNSVHLITSHQAFVFVLLVFFAVRCIAEFRFSGLTVFGRP